MQLQIDGDVIIYSSAWSAQKKDEDLAPLAQAQYSARAIIESCKNRYKTDDFVIHISPEKKHFRYELATIQPYKAKRPEKPVYYPDIKDFIIKTYKHHIHVSDNEEADDSMAQFHLRDVHNSCICTIDKDLNMIEGLHYNWVKKTEFTITPAEGIYNFALQCLTGDRTDNIPGIGKIGKLNTGPERAKKLLKPYFEFNSAMTKVRQLYSEVHGPIEGPKRLKEIGNLLWIRRKEGEVCLYV